MADPIRIANCSGFYGDRLSAAREMVDGGPIDVLTGDWLAELTMYIFSKTKERRPDGGFARTFVAQMADVLGDCLDRGIRVVANAGALDPHGCAAAVEQVAAPVHGHGEARHLTRGQMSLGHGIDGGVEEAPVQGLGREAAGNGEADDREESSGETGKAYHVAIELGSGSREAEAPGRGDRPRAGKGLER